MQFYAIKEDVEDCGILVKLRAHHLMCILTYVGEGYNDEFIANYDQIIARLRSGEPILIVSGPDDICAPLLSGNNPHCHRESVVRRDENAARIASKLLQEPIFEGARLKLSTMSLDALRLAYMGGQFSGACKGCEWIGLCKGVADGGYRQVRLQKQ